MTKEADKATKLEDFASDKEKSAAENGSVVLKGEAAKASKTDTNLEKFFLWLVELHKIFSKEVNTACADEALF